ncbi:MAG TPA: hypothetical protein VF173_11180 [Thermoanaerobaculia bacterium]|nr:hypothetical protein [Thermoanaerobaculia bacterium]
MREHPHVEGRWYTHVEGASISALDFYTLVRAAVARRKIPDLKIAEVEWQESGLGSGKRIYLRVSRENLNFDICAAPFGNGYFFSWWLARIPRVLLDLGFLFAALVAGGLLTSLLMKSQSGCWGCMGVFLGPVIFLGGLLGLGAYVRYGDQGLEPTVLSMPITGFLYKLLFRPVTYFNEDTAVIFRDAVHDAMLEGLDALIAKHGLRALAPEERKPTVRKLLG